MTIIKPNTTDKVDSIVPDVEYVLYQEHLQQRNPEWSFSIVPGFFKQSHLETDDTNYNSFDDHFGLAKESWDHLMQDLNNLNASVQDPSKEKYKLIFCARHGQGYHNKAIEIWGLEAWDDHYSHLEGAITPDGKEMNWAPDPFLTELGEKQAQLVNNLFKTEITKFNCPIPSKLFSSPFTRSAQTLSITMDGICLYHNDSPKELLSSKKINPLIMEDLRETIGEHLCDKRSNKTTFLKRMDGWDFQFEPNFQHDDIYYRDDWREPIHKQALRANSFLQHIFNNNDYNNDDVIYCASHSGEIKALIVATGHRQYIVPTAGMIPMLVKAVKN
jgi:broad specificity phosphatase PhoE